MHLNVVQSLASKLEFQEGFPLTGHQAPRYSVGTSWVGRTWKTCFGLHDVDFRSTDVHHGGAVCDPRVEGLTT